MKTTLIVSLYLFGTFSYAQVAQDYKRCKDKKVEVPLFEMEMSLNNNRRCFQLKARRALDYVGDNVAPSEFHLHQDSRPLPHLEFFKFCLDSDEKDNLKSLIEDLMKVGHNYYTYRDHHFHSRVSVMNQLNTDFFWGFLKENIRQEGPLFYTQLPRTHCKHFTMNEETRKSTEVGRSEKWPDHAHTQYLEKMKIYDQFLDIMVRNTEVQEIYNFVPEALSDF